MTGTSAKSADSNALSTELAFQRTWMSAERTLMAALRTALSLIGFGFTIFQFFDRLKEASAMIGAGHAPEHLGLAMVLLGNALLIAAMIQYRHIMSRLRAQEAQLATSELMPGASTGLLSPTFMVAILLLALGFLATTSMTFGWPR